MKLPSEVNILGVRYLIKYVDNPAEVDLYKRKSLWGQIDFWTRTIRIYQHELTLADIWASILHEVIHGIAQQLHLKCLEEEENHDALDILAQTLMDVLVRNGWFAIKEKEG